MASDATGVGGSRVCSLEFGRQFVRRGVKQGALISGRSYPSDVWLLTCAITWSRSASLSS